MASEEHFHDFSVRYPTKGMEHILGCTGCSAVQWGVPAYQLSDAAKAAVRDESLAMECLRLHDEIDTLKAKIDRMAKTIDDLSDGEVSRISREARKIETWDKSAFDVYNEWRDWKGLRRRTFDEFIQAVTADGVP